LTLQYGILAALKLYKVPLTGKLLLLKNRAKHTGQVLKLVGNGIHEQPSGYQYILDQVRQNQQSTFVQVRVVHHFPDRIVKVIESEVAG
jgi:hypothetical protein